MLGGAVNIYEGGMAGVACMGREGPRLYVPAAGHTCDVTAG